MREGDANGKASGTRSKRVRIESDEVKSALRIYFYVYAKTRRTGEVF